MKKSKEKHTHRILVYCSREFCMCENLNDLGKRNVIPSNMSALTGRYGKIPDRNQSNKNFKIFHDSRAEGI